VILVRDWSAEQREDAVTGGLRHVAIVVMDGIHHQLECRVDDCPRFLRIDRNAEKRPIFRCS
jgi:hypothetical protein